MLVRQIALCPALAVTDTILKALAMGTATLAVMMLSMLSLALVRRMIPEALRTTTHVVVIAAWVTLIQQALQACDAGGTQTLGVFLPLIVVNCIVLAHEFIFVDQDVSGAFPMLGVGRALGFMGALLGIGAIREILGYGSLFGKELFGPSFQPWEIMTLPAGGFFVLGSCQLLLAWFKECPSRRKRSEEAPNVG